MVARVKLPFEALVVRYVHDARTEEFLNIGVVLVCPKAPYAGAQFLPQWSRVTAAFPGADLVQLRRVARAFERRCAEWSAEASGQLTFDRAEDVRSLARAVIHPDDASIQTSPVVTGITSNPARSLSELFTLYAGAALERSTRSSREDAEVWRTFAEKVAQPDLLRQLRAHSVKIPHYELAFDNAWMNGHWNAAQPVSFDLLDARVIREKAVSWAGKLRIVRPHELGTHVYLLVGLPPKGSSKELRGAAKDAFAILRDQTEDEATVLTEEESEVLAKKIATDLAHHSEGESRRRGRAGEG